MQSSKGWSGSGLERTWIERTLVVGRKSFCGACVSDMGRVLAHMMLLAIMVKCVD